MARPQLSVRVDQELFDTIKSLETSKGVNRSTIVQDLIMRGLNNSETTLPDQSAMQKASATLKKLYAQLTQEQQKTQTYKKRAEEWQAYAQDMEEKATKQKSKRKELKQSVSGTLELQSHPLVAHMESGGLTFKRNGNDLVVTSIKQLLDFVLELETT